MDFRVTVDFRCAGQQNFGTAALGHPEHVDRTHHAGLDGLDRVELVMARGGGASQVVDLVDFQKDRQRHVVPNQFKIGFAQQMSHIGFLAGEEVIQTDNVMAFRDQALA